MRRKAFLLTEQLMTILLQAGFILVLVTAFYLMLNFYTKTQQVLTARNRAERVIQFVDDKVRHVGLGLWQCDGASDIRSHLKKNPSAARRQSACLQPASLYSRQQWNDE